MKNTVSEWIRVVASVLVVLPFLCSASCQKEGMKAPAVQDNAAGVGTNSGKSAIEGAETGERDGEWVARINGNPVSAEEIHEEFVGDSRLIHQMLNTPTERVLRIAVERHLSNRMFAEEAKKRRLYATAEPEIDLERDLVERIYYIRDFAGKIEVPEEEVREKSPSVWARIRISPRVFETFEEAASVREELASGRKRWEEGDKDGAGRTGGSWIWPYPNSGYLNKQQSDEIFSLKKGAITPVYKLGIGYSIFRLEEREDLPKAEIERLRNGIRSQIRQSRMRAVFDQWRTEHKVSRMDVERKGEFFQLIEAFEKGGRPKSTIVATMDGDWKLDWDTLIRVSRKFPNFRERMDPGDRMAFLGTVLDTVITARIISQGARKTGYRLPAEVDAELKRRENGILASVLVENILANRPAITDADVRDYYEAHREDYRNRKKVRAAHILVNTSGEAEEVFDKISRRELSFKAAEKAYSVDETAGIGGDLGWVVPGRLIRELEEVLFSMKEGEISRPVRSRYGFHILQVSGIDLDKDLTLEQVRPEIVTILEARREASARNNALAEIGANYTVEYNRENLAKLIRRLDGEKDDLFLDVLKKRRSPHGEMDTKSGGKRSPHSH